MNLLPNVRAEVKQITTQMRIKKTLYTTMLFCFPRSLISLELSQRRGKEFYHLCTKFTIVYITTTTNQSRFHKPVNKFLVQIFCRDISGRGWMLTTATSKIGPFKSRCFYCSSLAVLRLIKNGPFFGSIHQAAKRAHIPILGLLLSSIREAQETRRNNAVYSNIHKPKSI